MVGSLMILNPRGRKKAGRKGRRKMTAKQLKYFGPRKKRVARSGKVKPKVDLRPLFVIEDDKIKTELMSVVDILYYVRESAKKGMHTQRYKGLGEMNPQQLWDTTMDPQRRTILKVALEDAVEVDKTFAMLMGDEVEPRRQFIESYAHEVKNLDI